MYNVWYFCLLKTKMQRREHLGFCKAILVVLWKPKGGFFMTERVCKALDVAGKAFETLSNRYGVCGNDTGLSVAILAAAILIVESLEKHEEWPEKETKRQT